MLDPNGDVIVRMRTRAFAGRMASHRVMVEPDGSIQVYDAIAGHYTRAHSMPLRDQTRARRLAAERVREQAEYRRIITEAIKAGKVSREEREESSRRAGNVDG